VVVYLFPNISQNSILRTRNSFFSELSNQIDSVPGSILYGIRFCTELSN